MSDIWRIVPMDNELVNGNERCNSNTVCFLRWMLYCCERALRKQSSDVIIELTHWRLGSREFSLIGENCVGGFNLPASHKIEVEIISSVQIASKWKIHLQVSEIHQRVSHSSVSLDCLDWKGLGATICEHCSECSCWSINHLNVMSWSMLRNNYPTVWSCYSVCDFFFEEFSENAAKILYWIGWLVLISWTGNKSDSAFIQQLNQFQYFLFFILTMKLYIDIKPLDWI